MLSAIHSFLSCLFFHACFFPMIFFHNQAIPLQHPGRAYPHSHTVSIINSMPIPVQISPLPAIIRHTYGKENIQGNAEVSCAMGNTEMTFVGSTMEEHNYEVSCSAGNIDIGNRSFAGLATESDIDNGAANTYKLECAMGNITVKFQ